MCRTRARPVVGSLLDHNPNIAVISTARKRYQVLRQDWFSVSCSRYPCNWLDPRLSLPTFAFIATHTLATERKTLRVPIAHPFPCPFSSSGDEQVDAHLSGPDLRGIRYIYAVGAFCDTPLAQSMLHEELADPGTDLRVVAAQRPGVAVVSERGGGCGCCLVFGIPLDRWCCRHAAVLVLSISYLPQDIASRLT